MLSMFSRSGGLFGSRRLPGEVRTALTLEPRERVISHTHTPGDGYCVATTHALHLPGGPGGEYPRVTLASGGAAASATPYPEEQRPGGC